MIIRIKNSGIYNGEVSFNKITEVAEFCDFIRDMVEKNCKEEKDIVFKKLWLYDNYGTKDFQTLLIADHLFSNSLNTNIEYSIGYYYQVDNNSFKFNSLHDFTIYLCNA